MGTAYIQRLGYTVSHDESFEVSIGGNNATRTALVTHVLGDRLLANAHQARRVSKSLTWIQC